MKASNADVADGFGVRLAVDGTGRVLAIGARGEASRATGINGNQADNTAPGSGAVCVFAR